MQVESDAGFGDLVGGSAPMRRLRREIARLAPLRSTILLCGETGVGKGVVARAIHRVSRADRGAFVHVDCAALAPHLVESEIFGHERGAFTGAVCSRRGRFEHAARGTILLDEIGDLELPLQAKLLRVLQDRQYERLGGSRTLPMTARVVAATARDLTSAVCDGSFRADLYFRLAVIPLAIPPLRDRLADVPELLTAGFERLGRELGLAAPRLSGAALSRLTRHSWPGNVRELLNVAERLMVRYAGEPVTPEDVEATIDAGLPHATKASVVARIGRRDVDADSVEVISSELRATGGNVARAARRLGLPRSTLRHWIRRHDIR